MYLRLEPRGWRSLHELLFGYLRIAKRQQHIVIKNIVPTGAAWRPF